MEFTYETFSSASDLEEAWEMREKKNIQVFHNVVIVFFFFLLFQINSSVMLWNGPDVWHDAERKNYTETIKSHHNSTIQSHQLNVIDII